VDIIIVIVLVFHLVSIMHASSGMGSSAARESTGNPLPIHTTRQSNHLTLTN